MADTTSSKWEPIAGAGRVRFTLVRWLLAPRTTWQARRLAADFGPGMDARTAWTMTHLASHPEEPVHAMARRTATADFRAGER
ncbi:hypothetical protein ACIQU1_08815 [Streptomyces angustmyceticus]|uniref:hypothetical protein n=1 Tax=Streptomyces angustmyceticus TaxID=285578 RepID=UPI0038275565